MANKFLDSTGVKHLWDKIKDTYQLKGNYVTTDTTQTISGTKTYTGNNIFKNNYFEIKASSANDDSWIKLTNATDSGYYAFGIRRPYATYGLQMKYHPASGNDVYYNIWHAGNFTPSNYLTTSAASSTYQPKGDYLTSSSLSGYAKESWVNTQIANLVNSAPEALNTLGELATALQNHEDAYDALLTTVGGKLDKSGGGTITGDLTVTQDITAGHIATDSFEADGQILLGGSRIEHDGGGYYFDLPKKDGTAALTSDIPSVVNNLTSTSTSSSLSAAQGKALNDKFASYATTSAMSSAITSALGNYLPKSGGSLNNEATLKFTMYGSRTVTISGNSIDADMSADTGTWAGSFATVKHSKGTTTMLGWYGSKGDGLYSIFMGGSYDAPAMKMDASGNFTFKNLVTLTHDKAQLQFRGGHASYDGVISYQSSGNEAMLFTTKNAVTSFMFVNGEDTISNVSSARWKNLTPGLQIKNNKVSISKLITDGTTPTYNLDVGGTANATTIYENGTALSDKYQAKGTYIAPTTGSEYYSKYIQTRLQNKTSWYGTQYPIYAWWETGSICKWVVDNYETKVDRAVKDANGNTITSYYQPKLTSGTNIKTINGASLLGSGDITVSGGSSMATVAYNVDLTDGDSIDLKPYINEGYKIFKGFIQTNDQVDETITINVNGSRFTFNDNYLDHHIEIIRFSNYNGGNHSIMIQGSDGNAMGWSQASGSGFYITYSLSNGGSVSASITLYAFK